MITKKHLKDSLKAAKLLAPQALQHNSEGDCIIGVFINDLSDLKNPYTDGLATGINQDITEYIYDKARSIPVRETLEVHIKTSFELNSDEKIDIQHAIKTHYNDDIIDCNKGIKRDIATATVLMIIGILLLALCFTLSEFAKLSFIHETILVVSGFFMWNASDFYFISRNAKKRQILQFFRIYSAKVTFNN